ncbi:MAG: transcription termination factor Rho [Phycisphaerales bacterium]
MGNRRGGRRRGRRGRGGRSLGHAASTHATAPPPPHAQRPAFDPRAPFDAHASPPPPLNGEHPHPASHAPPAPQPKRFEDLTVIDPQPRITLEYRGCPDSCRLIDLFCPIGRGQRALIVSPPKAGKTTLLKDIAGGIARNHPDLELIALLVDERPEEVTDFRRSFDALGCKIPARVIASSNDHGIERHIQVSLQTLDECKRAVERGRHLVVVLDSITRLSRAFNNSRRFASSGRTMTGGIDAKAMEMPRQIFGSARNTEDAGSLTIIATCLVDTGSAMDQVIFEEFKGSGNMELVLDRKISERRLFPAINLASSGTRKEHLLLADQELKTVTALRRRLMATPPHIQVEQLLAALKRFPTNAEMVGAASA